MPRSPRIISSTGIYHAIIRSVNQQLIFEESEDYHKFLLILSDAKSKYEISIYAYCIMDNHVHLLIQSTPEHLAPFFNSLLTRFVRWYNNKYERSGHLFQGRFHSKVVESDTYFINTLIYIHNNPVKAGACRFPSEYAWSSFNAYYGAKNPLIDLALPLKIAGSKDSMQHIFALNAVSPQDKLMQQQFFEEEHEEPRHRVNEEDMISKFKELTNLISSFEIINLPKAERNEIVRTLVRNHFTYNQISRLLGISVPTVYRICKMNK